MSGRFDEFVQPLPGPPRSVVVCWDPDKEPELFLSRAPECYFGDGKFESVIMMCCSISIEFG